jgi:hypothetical protein
MMIDVDDRVVERVSEDDRLWFKRNPDEHERYRDWVPGELPRPTYPGGDPEGAVQWAALPDDAFQVHVVQIRPGVRMRVVAYVALSASQSGI